MLYIYVWAFCEILIFTEHGFPVDLNDIKNIDEPLTIDTGKRVLENLVTVCLGFD